MRRNDGKDKTTVSDARGMIGVPHGIWCECRDCVDEREEIHGRIRSERDKESGMLGKKTKVAYAVEVRFESEADAREFAKRVSEDYSCVLLEVASRPGSGASRLTIPLNKTVDQPQGEQR